MRVVIIGAGIVGASLAYALSLRGADVFVVDAQGPAAGATGRSFGWINASFYHDAPHFALRAEGIEAYRRLWCDLKVPVTWSGCLCWEEQGAALDAQAAALADMGYSAKVLDAADFARREPHVKAPEGAVFFEAEAAAEPAALTQLLLDASGARLVLGCHVEKIVAGAKVDGIQIEGSLLPADRVIVAGGTGSPPLLAPLGVALPMLHRPGAIFQTASLPPLLSHVCVAPIGEFRQNMEGRIVMPTALSHQGDGSEALAERPDVLADAAAARLQNALRDVDVHWRHVAVAQRPVPQDGLPVIGACGPEGLFAAVMHSGITLAPVVAEILAADIMGGGPSNAQAALVAPYRPQRFQSVFS